MPSGATPGGSARSRLVAPALDAGAPVLPVAVLAAPWRRGGWRSVCTVQLRRRSGPLAAELADAARAAINTSSTKLLLRVLAGSSDHYRLRMAFTRAEDGCRLHYQVVGRSTGEPVLLIQGLGADMTGWMFQRLARAAPSHDRARQPRRRPQ